MINRLYNSKFAVLFFVILFFIVFRTLVFQFFNFKLEFPKSSGIVGYLLKELTGYSVLSFLLATVFILAQGLLINRLAMDFAIVERPGYSVLFFSLILNSSFLQSFALNYIHVGILLLQIGVFFIYTYLQQNFKITQLFIGSFFFGISAVCVAEFYWLITLLISIVLIFKSIKASDVVVIIFGLFMPFYLISSIGYLTSSTLDFMTTWKVWIIQYQPVEFNWLSNGWDILLIIVFAVVAVFGLIKFYANYFRNNVETRKSKLAFTVISGYLILVFLFRAKEYSVYFVVLSMPLSIYLSNYFKGDKMQFWKDLTAYILLGYWVLNLYQQLL